MATRLERPASTARDGSGSDSIEQHAATGEVTAPHLRRVVSEEDIEAAELMCSLRDVVDTPPTVEEPVGLVTEPRAATRTRPTPTTESRGRRGKHPAKKNIPKSPNDPRGGGGRVLSLLTRARGIERQLTPRIPARYGSITEALAYIDAQPPADIELEKHIGKSVRRKAKRRGRFEIPDNNTRGDANSPKNDQPPRSPSLPGTALDSFVTPKPSPPGTPTETPPAHKRLGSVRAFLARSGELLERLTADGAEELVEDEKAGEMEEVREKKNPAGPSDSPRNRAGSILDVPPKKRRRVHAPTFEPGCARARPFVRRGDVGDEDVAVYRPDPDFDANEVEIPGGDPHAWRWSTEQRSVVSPPNLLHDTSNVKTREVQRLMLPCVVGSTKDGGDLMDAKRRAASSAAMNSTSGPPVSPVGSVSVSPTTANERVAERRRLRSDATRVVSASSPAGSPPQPFSQPFSQQPLLTAPANPPSPMTKAAREKAVAAEHERCKNLAPFFRADRSRISGLGVYATVPLPAKCMALEYVGEVITNAEADLREELERAEIVKAAKREGWVATACELARAATYMFTLDPAVGTIVDATRMGNITRFVNHCCEPNCVTRSVKVGGARKIVLVTQRDVAAGEELTYDYKFKPDTPENEAPCDCGADRCRGIINVR